MGGLDAGEQPKAAKKGGLRHPKRRVSVRIDMTPMVDIAFLLLIFFMVTTVFRAPQAMEVNMPPSDSHVEVPMSNVMTMYVDAAENFFFRLGDGGLQATSMKDLQELFKDNARLNPELIILVKLHREARYEMMVDIMDELEVAGMQRFSLVPMTEEDLKLLEAAQ
jgi:biopolymer transport protein ExbD